MKFFRSGRTLALPQAEGVLARANRLPLDAHAFGLRLSDLTS